MSFALQSHILRIWTRVDERAPTCSAETNLMASSVVGVAKICTLSRAAHGSAAAAAASERETWPGMAAAAAAAAYTCDPGQCLPARVVGGVACSIRLSH